MLKEDLDLKLRVVKNPLLYMTEVLGLESTYIKTVVEAMTMIYDTLVYDENVDENIMNAIREPSVWIDFINKNIYSIMEIHKDAILNSSEELEDIRVNLHRLFAHLDVDEDLLYSEMNNLGQMEKEYCHNMVKMINQDLDLIYGDRESYVDYTSDYMDELFEDEQVQVVEKPKKKEKVKEDVVFDAIKQDEYKDVRKEVNDLDQIFDVNIKKPRKILDNAVQFEKLLLFRRAQMYSLVSMLNHMNDKKFMKIKKHGEILLKELQYKNIKKKSFLESDDLAYTDSDLFKARFLSRIVFWTARHLEDLVSVLYMTSGERSYIEYIDKAYYLDEISANTAALVYKMLENLPCGKELSMMEYYMMFADDLSPSQIVKKMNTLDLQSALLSDSFKMFNFEKHSIKMDTLLKLSYLSGSTQRKVKGIFEPNKKFYFGNKRLEKSMVESLGRKLRKASKKKEISMPLMFEFYMDAKPVVLSKWREINTNLDLAIGVCAMSYYGFVNGNERIREKIRGITEVA